MRIRPLAVCTLLAASLAAQDAAPAFNWVALRGGFMSYDPQEYAKAGSFYGIQGGHLFAERRYGLSFEGHTSRPKSELLPGTSLSHTEFSATLLTGLLPEAPGGLWPYFGVGLGAVSLDKVDRVTLVKASTRAAALHASLGFLHRPGRGLLWGVDGRYVLTVGTVDLKEFQTTAMLGFTWGGGSAPAPRPAPYTPPAASPEPPPAPTPVPPPPAPEPTPVVTAPAPAPLAPVTQPAPAVSPAPAPKVEVAVAAPPPPPPPPPSALSVSPRTTTPEPPAPQPAPVAAADETATLSDRLDALRRGDMPRSVALGRVRAKAIPRGHWTLRLEVASLPTTLANAVKAFPSGKPDLFVVPIQLRGAKVAYQLFLGDYPTQAAAQQAVKGLPGFFLEGGNRPKPFLGTAIPASVNR